MSDRIEVGDKVRVNFIERPNQCQSPYFMAEVLYIPNSTGDMFHLKVESGAIVYLNPNCSNLESLVKL